MSKGQRDIVRSVPQAGLLAFLIAVVCAAVFVVHWPALSSEAISFDDDQYLIENRLVQNPGWGSAGRFLTEVLEPSTVEGYYQPLSMISLMVDHAMGGRTDNLMPFHRMSLVLHVANTALACVLLYMLFGRAWAAAGVGLLFGVHPMTVETIAWVGERKTVLAAFFALWSLVFYVRYSRKEDWKFYVASVVMYVLALMSKPTSTPLPVLMLLIDWWPLKRINIKVVLEKVPFFVVGAISAVITYISQSRTAAVLVPGEYNPLDIPLVLCHNIIFYLHKIVWPINLSSYYAYPEPLALSEPIILASVIGTFILIGLLVISLRWTRGLVAGWGFFFIGILPTMQIIGFSNTIASDKFAYLPSVGLLMALTAFLCWFFMRCKVFARYVLVVIAVLAMAGAEARGVRGYLVYWRDSVSLYEHMLVLSPEAALVHHNLGIVFVSHGRLDEAAGHFRKALQITPGFAKAHTAFGNMLASQGKLDEALSHHRQALELKPEDADSYNNLGSTLAMQGKTDEAISHFRQALKLDPDYATVYSNMALTFQLIGKTDEAISHYRHALKLDPDYAAAHFKLGNLLAGKGKLGEAELHYRKVLEIDGSFEDARYNLEMVLKMQGKSD